jgi:hypothetical protein
VIRVSHRNLEEARGNPEAYVRRMARERGEGFRLSVPRCWQLATYEFHRRGSLDLAEAYFDGLCGRFKRTASNLAKIRDYRGGLRRYVEDYQERGRVFVATMVRISMDLGNDVFLAGEVGRVDVVLAGGYGAYLIGQGYEGWQGQLRMPLLQRYVAGEFGVAVADVRVGVYSFDRGHEEQRFTPAEVTNAFEESVEIARRIARAATGRR